MSRIRKEGKVSGKKAQSCLVLIDVSYLSEPHYILLYIVPLYNVLYDCIQNIPIGIQYTSCTFFCLFVYFHCLFIPTQQFHPCSFIKCGCSGANMSTQLLSNVKYYLCALKGFLTWLRGWLHVLHPQKEPQTLGDMLSVSNIWTLLYK